MSTFCDYCENHLPDGCYHLNDESEHCKLDKRTEDFWLIGKAILNRLDDRKGMVGDIDDEIKAEIVEDLGKTALKELAKIQSDKTIETK